MSRMKNVASGFIAAVLLAVGKSVLAAQEMSGLPGSTLSAQSLRPYWHVFIAYAIAITVVLIWVVSIGRRLKDVERKLGE